MIDTDIESAMKSMWDAYRISPTHIYALRSYILDRPTDELRASLKKCKGALKRNVLHVLRKRARAISRGISK